MPDVYAQKWKKRKKKAVGSSADWWAALIPTDPPLAWEDASPEELAHGPTLMVGPRVGLLPRVPVRGSQPCDHPHYRLTWQSIELSLWHSKRHLWRVVFWAANNPDPTFLLFSSSSTGSDARCTGIHKPSVYIQWIEIKSIFYPSPSFSL